MKILITGHMGFIGSYLSKELSTFTGIDIKEENDILDCNLPEADVVIHLAAESSVIESIKNPFKDARTNILGTIRLAQKYRNSRFIFASSGGAIQETIESPYGLSKLCAEKYIKMICKDYVILRLPNIYGPGSASVVDKFLQQDKNIIYGDGNATRVYCHINDLIDAIFGAIRWPKGEYKLGTDQVYSVNEIAETIGKEIEFQPKRKGELDESTLENNTPGWKAYINLIDYIEEHNK